MLTCSLPSGQKQAKPLAIPAPLRFPAPQRLRLPSVDGPHHPRPLPSLGPPPEALPPISPPAQDARY